MHPLPEFSYPAGSRSPVLGLLGACAFAWVAVLLLWWHALGLGSPPPGPWWLALGLGATALAYGAWLLSRLPSGYLHWCVNHPQEPGYWAWQAAVPAAEGEATPAAGRLRLVSRLEWALDLQWAVLLQLQQAGQAPCWVWCLRHTAPRRWGALRRSLQYTRQHPPSLPE